MIGLPHLSEGKLLDRARRLQQPVLISANALSRWSRRRGWREWTGWSFRPLANAAGLHSLCLDSAGFSAMVTYGGYPWTVDDYIRLAAAYPFGWWATDYASSIRSPATATRCSTAYRAPSGPISSAACAAMTKDPRHLHASHPGRLPSDYERCAEALSLTIERAGLVGVGSMCKRPIHGPEGLMAVVDHLDRVLPRLTRLHLSV
jgi:hypothetical protein